MTLLAVAGSVPVLALGVMVAGPALAFPPYADVVAAQVPADRRDSAWSAISSGTGWGVALAGPVAIVAGDRWRLGRRVRRRGSRGRRVGGALGAQESWSAHADRS